MKAQAMLTALMAERGVKVEFDENGACTLPLGDERVLHLQFREELGELVFVAILGTVPEELRGLVFTRLLAADYYWKDTLGATLSWHGELEQVVLAYPLKVESVDEAKLIGTLDRFVDLQAAWAERLQSELASAEALLAVDEADEELSDLELMAELSEGADRTDSPAAAESEVRFDA